MAVAAARSVPVAVSIAGTVSVMAPPRAATAPVIEVLPAQWIAVAVIVVHPRPVSGVIIVVVPAAAEADLDEAAAIVRPVVAVVAIAVVIGIGVGVIIAVGTGIARRRIACPDVAVIAAAKRGRRQRAERDGEGTSKTLDHGLVLLGRPFGSNGRTRHNGPPIARVELNLR
jgi:hypothetical protein